MPAASNDVRQCMDEHGGVETIAPALLFLTLVSRRRPQFDALGPQPAEPELGLGRAINGLPRSFNAALSFGALGLRRSCAWQKMANSRRTGVWPSTNHGNLLIHLEAARSSNKNVLAIATPGFTGTGKSRPLRTPPKVRSHD